ncbi:MAG: type II toxin-antitoxin system HicA family toxin [Candidatus Melainabacteria bacterium]
MSRIEKLKLRLLQRPRDFTWDELEKLLAALGYVLVRQGKTGGSRRRFVSEDGAIISLHQPHPGNILKRYQIDQVLDTLTQEGLL